MRDTIDEHAAVADAVKSINDAWLSRAPERMRELLHQDVVMVSPGFEQALRGRDAAIGSFADFTSQAVIQHFDSSDPTVELFGDTAIAWFAWSMKYSLAGENYDERGHDVYVFSRADGRWQAVWRTLSVTPSG